MSPIWGKGRSPVAVRKEIENLHLAGCQSCRSAAKAKPSELIVQGSPHGAAGVTERNHSLPLPSTLLSLSVKWRTLLIYTRVLGGVCAMPSIIVLSALKALPEKSCT